MMPVELTVVTVTYSTTFATFMNLTHGEIYFGKPCSFSFFFFFWYLLLLKNFFYSAIYFLSPLSTRGKNIAVQICD